MEREKRFFEVRKRRSGLRNILHRASLAAEVAAGMASGPDKYRGADDNVGLYLHVPDLVADALEPWRKQILSLGAQVGDKDLRLGMELHQLALQYKHRLSR